MSFELLSFTLPNFDYTILALYVFNALIVYYIENVIYKAIKHWITSGPNHSFTLQPIDPSLTYSKEPIS